MILVARPSSIIRVTLCLRDFLGRAELSCAFLEIVFHADRERGENKKLDMCLIHTLAAGQSTDVEDQMGFKDEIARGRVIYTFSLSKSNFWQFTATASLVNSTLLAT